MTETALLRSGFWSKGGARYLLASALACTWLAMLLFGARSVDLEILSSLYGGDDPALVAVARVLTVFGDPTMLIGLGLAAAAWLYHSRGRSYAIGVVAVTLLGRAVVEAQKYAIDRPRPAEVLGLVHTRTPSFPSGHATSSMIVYVTLAIVLTRSRRARAAAVCAALLCSIAIGTSRSILGVHCPSDVVAGWSFGLLWVLLILPLAERLAN
jgi:undecaprenyl-diphosphatase